MLRAVRHFIWYGSFDFITRQVVGELFLARLSASSVSLVLLDDLLRFLQGQSQPLGRIRGVRGVAEIELQLMRIQNITLTATAKRLLQEIGDREFQLLLF